MVFDGRANLVDVAFDDADSGEQQVVRGSHLESDAPPSSPEQHAGSSQTGVGVAVGAASTKEAAAAQGAGSDVEHAPIQIPPAFEATPDDTPGLVATKSPTESAHTPFPEIGLHDPLAIETMRGPDTVYGPATRARFADTASGPATRSRFPEPGSSPSGIAGAIGADAGGTWPAASGDTISRSGPPTTGEPGAAAANASLRHDAVVMPDWEGPAVPARGRARWVYGFLATILLGALAAQALFHYRNVIAADYPVTRHHLIAACTTLGCRIEPLRNREEIAIESHDLQADPAHQGLLVLRTTLRNQSRHALAFPHLELELDDNNGKAIVRRVFTPLEYAGGAADFSLGIPANAEWNIKLFLDASSVPAGAYHLYHFYP